MAVYVDDAKNKFGGMLMSHLWADTDEELLAMVDKIGVQRKWIQGHPKLSFGKHKSASWVHFDIAQSKRALAIVAGAVPTDKYGPSEHTCKLVLADPKATEDRKAFAREKLETIKKIREGNNEATKSA